MRLKKHLPQLFIFAAAAIIVAACQKQKFGNLDATKDMALAENLFSDSYKQVAGAGQATADSLKAYNEILAGCGTLSITPFDTVNWPKTVTLDFGNSNCIGNDGRSRRGKIIAVYTHWLRSPGTVVTVNFNEYFVNDHKILGTKTYTNNGYNAQNHLTFTVSFPNCQIVKPNNGGTVLWSTTRVHEWTEGEATFTPMDDVWDITGTANGTSSDGVNFTLNIVQKLNVKYGCRWIRSGILDMDIDGLSTIIVNYGPGTCDANAVATYSGTDYPFVMQ